MTEKLLCIILLVLGCSKSESIQIGGSTTVLPAVSRAAERYTLHNPGVNVIVNAGGSGVGINQVAEGQIDIGMSSRSVTGEEKARYPGVKFVRHVIGRDAVVPVVSSAVYHAGVRALTLQQIATIYRGEVTNWKDVDGPDREILVVDKQQSRGTRHVFMQAIFGDKDAAAPGADLVLGSNNEEQTAIAQSDAAIGMLSRPWLNADVRGVDVIVDGQSVAPTLENINNGAYPITRALLLLTNGEPAGRVRDFLDFVLSPEGQKIVEASGYVRVQP